MKKIICIYLLIFMNTHVYGVTLCKKTNTAVAILRKSVGGEVKSVTGNYWEIKMSDGTNVKGKGLCTNMPGAGYGIVNTGVADTEDEGSNCFCKMKLPAASYFVFIKTYNDNTSCANNCAKDCAIEIAEKSVYRSAIYESIW